jgi:hypothetical protein
MIPLRIFLFFIFALSMSATAFSSPYLATFQWKNRLLVLLAPSANDTELQMQQAIASEATADCTRSHFARGDAPGRSAPP